MCMSVPRCRWLSGNSTTSLNQGTVMAPKAPVLVLLALMPRQETSIHLNLRCTYTSILLRCLQAGTHWTSVYIRASLCSLFCSSLSLLLKSESRVLKLKILFLLHNFQLLVIERTLSWQVTAVSPQFPFVGMSFQQPAPVLCSAWYTLYQKTSTNSGEIFSSKIIILLTPK